MQRLTVEFRPAKQGEQVIDTEDNVLITLSRDTRESYYVVVDAVTTIPIRPPEPRYLLIDQAMYGERMRPIDCHRLLSEAEALTAQEIIDRLITKPMPSTPDERIDVWLDGQSAPAGTVPENLIQMCAEYLRRVRMAEDEHKNSQGLIPHALRDQAIFDLDYYFTRALAMHVPVMQAVFHAIREKNMDRCVRWHRDETEPWTLADWSNAVGGEWGELANKIKKIRRLDTGLLKHRDGEADRDDLVAAAVQEVADVFIYLQICLTQLDPELNMYDVIAAKFNATSDEFGFHYKLPEYSGPTEDD